LDGLFSKTTVWYLRMRELERPGAESDPPAASGPLDRDAAAPVARPLIIDTVAGLRAALAPVRLGGRSIGLVPTMGAFHEGHASLMRRAGEECDVVVVSLFVNPSQFGPGDDLERYPRDLARDAGIASSVGVDFLFVPSLDEIYPAGFATTVAVAGLGDVLCGAPGRRGAEHFRGVVTVVTKLLNICQPDVAYFGAKDYQPATIVR
jgi:pantoate--beta-alanine ligase